MKVTPKRKFENLPRGLQPIARGKSADKIGADFDIANEVTFLASTPRHGKEQLLPVDLLPDELSLKNGSDLNRKNSEIENIGSFTRLFI